MPKFDDDCETLGEEKGPETPVAETPEQEISYRYSEPRIIEEIINYIDATYDQHYSRNKFQATEFILDGGHGDGFCIGNIMKYAQRYGKKDGYNRKDLLKIIHYAIIALHNHDMNERK